MGKGRLNIAGLEYVIRKYIQKNYVQGKTCMFRIEKMSSTASRSRILKQMTTFALLGQNLNGIPPLQFLGTCLWNINLVSSIVVLIIDTGRWLVRVDIRSPPLEE
jgi:hypothetical protein